MDKPPATTIDQQLLAAIVASSTDAIVSKSLDGTIRTWNEAARRLYGYAAGEAVGRSIAMLFPPERTDELRRILEHVASGRRIALPDTVRVRKDGSRVQVSLAVSPVFDDAANVVAAATIARDITAQKAREREAR